MASFGQRRAPESFGRLAEPAGEVVEDRPAAEPGSAGTIHVDIKINPESLARLQEQLAQAVCHAVETGFARAGTMSDPT